MRRPFWYKGRGEPGTGRLQILLTACWIGMTFQDSHLSMCYQSGTGSELAVNETECNRVTLVWIGSVIKNTRWPANFGLVLSMRPKTQWGFCLLCFLLGIKEFNVIVLVKFFSSTHSTLRTFACFFLHVTVKVSLAFTIQLTHAAMKFVQEQVKRMIYYLHGAIFRQTHKQ